MFTKKKNGKRYRYYCNQTLAEDKLHPDKTRSRLPSHEIESFVERAVRDNIATLANEDDGVVLDHLLANHNNIPTYDLVRSCVKRVIVNFDFLTVKFNPEPFKKLVERYLNVSVNESAEPFEINIPFQTLRSRDTSIIIRPGKIDIFDMTPEDKKRLVQGIVWRDEHFNGTYISDIAKRENCSSRYIRNRIMGSFEFLN